MKKYQRFIKVKPTTLIDIKLGAVTYHTTVNDICDLFLNLMATLTDGDLERLRQTGSVARQELSSRRIQPFAGHLAAVEHMHTRTFGNIKSKRSKKVSQDGLHEKKLTSLPDLGVIASAQQRSRISK